MRNRFVLALVLTAWAGVHGASAAQPAAGSAALVVDGDVTKPLSLTSAELKALPRTKVEVTAENGTIKPTIAAASDLQFALEAIAQAFTAETGERVTLVFGSSGNLARQAVNGAPYELFLSADEAFVDLLADAGYARDRGMLYAIGRIVLFAPRGSPLMVDDRMTGLRALMERGSRIRFAIANPEHAPYGRAAEAALRARGLWDVLQPTLVLGENISQTAQFATAGGAAGGILAYSLVLAPALKDRGTYALIPESLHPPLRQRMVLLKRAGPVAQRFYQYLQGPGARALFEQYGFALPK